jgi:hypothetical protein
MEQELAMNLEHDRIHREMSKAVAARDANHEFGKFYDPFIADKEVWA